MMHLTPNDWAKLEGIVAAGGLTQPSDVVRIAVTPEDPEVSAGWKRYLARNYDSLVAMAQRICGPLDLVLFDGDVVTVCRHPANRQGVEFVRSEVTSQFNDKLFGNGGGPRLRQRRTTVSPQRTALDLGSLRADDLSPQLASAIRIIAGDEPIDEPAPPPEPPAAPAALDVKMQRVVRAPGQAAVWLRASRPQTAGGNGGADYFRSAVDLVNFDIALVQQAAAIAKRMLQERSPPVQLMVPMNINGLRRPEHRTMIVTALRGLDSDCARRMEPVLVRCEQGVPQSVIGEAAGYLRKTFGLVWVFAGRHADPRTFLWSDMKMGLVVSGADPGKGGVEAWRAAADKFGWQLGVLG